MSNDDERDLRAELEEETGQADWWKPGPGDTLIGTLVRERLVHTLHGEQRVADIDESILVCVSFEIKVHNEFDLAGSANGQHDSIQWCDSDSRGM